MEESLCFACDESCGELLTGGEPVSCYTAGNNSSVMERRRHTIAEKEAANEAPILVRIRFDGAIQMRATPLDTQWRSFVRYKDCACAFVCVCECKSVRLQYCNTGRVRTKAVAAVASAGDTHRETTGQKKKFEGISVPQLGCWPALYSVCLGCSPLYFAFRSLGSILQYGPGLFAAVFYSLSPGCHSRTLGAL